MESNIKKQYYSCRNAITGFTLAAFQLCQLTVTNPITKVSIPASIKTHQLMSVCNAKFSSQL